MKSDDERFDRAVATLYEILDATPEITSGYEDGMVAGMIDFLSGWFCGEVFYGVDSKSEDSREFTHGYRRFVPSPTDHPLDRPTPKRWVIL
jgi:hypothetical protein